MKLVQIAEYLQDNGLGVMGENLFVNMMPVDCLSGILLRDPPTGAEIDYELPGYFKSHFRLIVRATNYEQGRELIESAAAALTISDTSIGDIYFRFMRPRTQPVAFPISPGNLMEFLIDMRVIYME